MRMQNYIENTNDAGQSSQDGIVECLMALGGQSSNGIMAAPKQSQSKGRLLWMTHVAECSASLLKVLSKLNRLPV